MSLGLGARIRAALWFRKISSDSERTKLLPCSGAHLVFHCADNEGVLRED